MSQNKKDTRQRVANSTSSTARRANAVYFLFGLTIDTKCIYFIDYKSLAYHGNQYIVKIGDNRYFGYQIEMDEEFPFHKKQRKFFQDMRNNNDKNKCHLAKVKTIRKFILKRIYVYDVHN